MIKQQKNCQSCNRNVHNLSNATCGHKICFNCVRATKGSHKCPSCLTQPLSRGLISPIKPIKQYKQLSTNIKDTQPRKYTSPAYQNMTTPVKRNIINQQQNINNKNLLCQQHQEPLSLFSKSSKDLVCSVCLCDRTKPPGDIVPLRQAQDVMRRQLKFQKQQAKNILISIDSANKIVSKNCQIFRKSYENSLKIIQQCFKNRINQLEQQRKKVIDQLSEYLQIKIDDCKQITTDLVYLSSLLRQFRDSCGKQTQNLNQIVYLFTSFKVVKNTIKKLNLQYISYNKEIQLAQNNYLPTEHLIKLNLDLPLKLGQKKKSRSHSCKNRKQSFTPNKRHQMSLNSNSHGISQGQQQRNLYKKLLKDKYNL